MDKRSKCQKGFLHRWQIVQMFSQGAKERCDICGQGKFFKKDIPNRTYLAFHNRQALQPNQKQFLHEYPTATTTNS